MGWGFEREGGVRLGRDFATPILNTMTKKSPNNMTRVIRIRCEVTRSDIDAMLDDYESGMADATKSNAISRSVRRTIGLKEMVILERRQGGRTELDVGGYLVPLEKEISEWLILVETGFVPKPFIFELSLPESLCGSRILDGAVEDTAIGAQAKPTAA